MFFEAVLLAVFFEDVCSFCEAAKINMDIIPSLNDLMQQGQDTADL